MRLNKFLAHSGIGTRRQADQFIRKGRVTINDEVVDNPAHFVDNHDVVCYEGKVIKKVKQNVYILMNKPKQFTCEYDVENSKSVAKILRPKISNVVSVPLKLRDEDRGLILLTDDEEITAKLSNKDHEVKQVFEVVLDKPISSEDMSKVEQGFEHDHEKFTVSGIDYIIDKGQETVGVTMKVNDSDYLSRLFTSLGYNIEVLDRMYIAGLTKKDLPRGFFRKLNSKEEIFLRHFF